jgi:hypothetical protein
VVDRTGANSAFYNGGRDLMQVWMTRGTRQNDFDLWWKTRPVLVRGNWKNPKGRDSPKGYYSYETVSREVALLITEDLPERGEIKLVK